MVELRVMEVTPGAAENATAPSDQGNDSANGWQATNDLVNLDERDVIHYAAFDANGIHLTDETLLFAESGDNLGYVSAQVSDASSQIEHTIRIDFAQPYTLDRLTLHWHEYYAKKVRLSASCEDGSTPSETMTLNAADAVIALQSPFEGVQQLNVIVLETEHPNQLVRMTGLDFGVEHSYTEFEGPVEVVHEIAIDYSDTPGSNMSCTMIQRQGTLPDIGRTAYVYDGDQCFGKFQINEIRRTGPFTWELQGIDDLQQLEDIPSPEGLENTNTVNNMLKKINAASSIRIQPIEAATGVYGVVDPADNCRVQLTRIVMGIGRFISTSMQRRLHIFQPEQTGIRIDGDRLLGDATYTPIAAPAWATLVIYHRNENNEIEKQKTYKIQNQSSFSDAKSTQEYNECYLYTEATQGDVYAPMVAQVEATAFRRNEIAATILWNGEKVGDIVTIETPYDGDKTGTIKSAVLHLGAEITADLIIIEEQEGGAA